MKLIPVPKSTPYLPIMERLLDAGKVMVHLLPGLLGVRVPAQFRQLPVLRLNFSYRFGIADFQVDERGVRASLSFGGVNQFCDIPWGAVLALSSEPTDEFYVWVENFSLDQLEPILPAELIQQLRMIESMASEEPETEEDSEEESSDEKDADSEEDASEDDKEDGEDEDGDDDDDVPPGGWGPLRLV